MAEMLRKGAKMLSLSCPECGSPLFQLKNGEIICPRENRVVKILKDGEDENHAEVRAELEKTLTGKLNYIAHQLEAEKDPAQIKFLGETVIILLDALNRLRVDERKV